MSGKPEQMPEQEQNQAATHEASGEFSEGRAGRNNPSKPAPASVPVPVARGPLQPAGEVGGPKGPEPTRYGDWEFKGRCSDF